jgi:hypothetical protein
MSEEEEQTIKQIIKMTEKLKQIGFDEVQATILIQLTALNKSWLKDFNVGAVIKIKNGIRLKILLGKYITTDIVYNVGLDLYDIIFYVGNQEVKRLEMVYWDQLVEEISYTLKEI